MSNFILQEAHEKANELRVRTEHDFNLEKQTLIHKAKLDVVKEFEEKAKEEEVKARIQKSSEIGASRVSKMKYRDTLLAQLLTSATQRCGLVSGDANYSSLLKALVVQCLIKIEENSVTIYVRSEDVSKCEAVLPSAIQEFVAIMKQKANVDLKPDVTLNSDPSKHLSKETSGGVIATADQGRIVCDNTMKARLELVYEELLPSIRAILFPEGQ
ncbi:hypothetical protein TrST_g6042 [Triparma strigata]|uniref:V-type proton ATPase subunit E n=2 Tax=Triparma TaxID=722752 RepID=A0A9W7AZ43_9STRA|nr:hypothetical protein TrST_g6042 [Triparma strigata]